MSKRSKQLWGTLELESATGKNSVCEGSGQKLVSNLAKLAQS